MKKFRKGDDVVVLTGRDKGKRGTILRMLDEKPAELSKENHRSVFPILVCITRILKRLTVLV
jgi:ribosomal protein L24